jgi:hypothetical protein
MKRVRQKEAGVGGTIAAQKIEQLPELRVDILGRQLNIKKANFTLCRIVTNGTGTA